MKLPTESATGTYWRRLLSSLAREGFRFGVLSIFSLALGYVLTRLLHTSISMPVEAAYTWSVLLCSVINFLGCRYYVFRGPRGPMLSEATKFFPSILVFRAIEVMVFSAINEALDNYHVAYLATAVVSTLFKLLLSRVFIFKRHG